MHNCSSMVATCSQRERGKEKKNSRPKNAILDSHSATRDAMLRCRLCPSDTPKPFNQREKMDT